MELNRNTGILIAAALVGAAAVVYLSRPRGTDEQRIRRLIEAVRVAAEQKSASGMAEALAADYRDAQGLDRQELRRMLTGRFLQSKGDLSCVAVPEEIEVAEDGRTATAVVWAAGLEGGSLGGMELPENAEAFRIDARLHKAEDGEWRFVWHEHTRVAAAQVLELMTDD